MILILIISQKKTGQQRAIGEVARVRLVRWGTSVLQKVAPMAICDVTQHLHEGIVAMR